MVKLVAWYVVADRGALYAVRRRDAARGQCDVQMSVSYDLAETKVCFERDPHLLTVGRWCQVEVLSFAQVGWNGTDACPSVDGTMVVLASLALADNKSGSSLPLVLTRMLVPGDGGVACARWRQVGATVREHRNVADCAR